MSFLRLLSVCLASLPLLLPARSATILVDDTFSDGSSRNQNLAANSLNLFDGRTGPAGVSGGANFTRTDSVGSFQLNLANSTSSQGAWGFFTGNQATTTGSSPVSSGPWSNSAPVTLQVGDTLTVIEKFSLGGLKSGQDLRLGLFDSGGTRNLSNTTGGQNDASFSNDIGYSLAFFPSGGSTPFILGKRDLALAASLSSLNNLFLNLGSFPTLPAASGAVMPAAQTLVNETVYTLTFSVYRRDATTNVVTASVSGDLLPSSYQWQAVDTSAPVISFDTFTAARFNGAAFADRITFTEFQVVYAPALPVITAQPTFGSGGLTQTISLGGQVNLSVGAAGAGLTYQWRHDGQPVPNATTPQVTLTDLQLGDSGAYDVMISNSGGSVISDPVLLTVVDRPVSPPPHLDRQPVSQAVNNGTNVSFSVGASGQDLTYQWSKNGALLPSAKSAILTLNQVTPSDAAIYQVSVSNEGGTVTSSAVSLTVLSPNLRTVNLAPSSNSGSPVNPDSPLRLTFAGPPAVGASGTIKIYDAATNAVVDTIDASSPSQTGSVSFLPRLPYQSKTIGGVANFNYYPVLISSNTATIYPRNGSLVYGKTYYVKIDPGFFVDPLGSFAGITDPMIWRFTAKPSGPAIGSTFLTVAADGNGDFNTIQGAIDFVPVGNTVPTTIFIRKGTYPEIVYFQSKNALTFLGEDRRETVLTYPNNNTFNSAGGVYHRGVFYGNNVSNTVVTNLTLQNSTLQGGSQAEALILTAGTNARNLVTRVELKSFQDTLQLNGPTFVSESTIEGDVDFVWGNGPSFFQRCELKILRSGGYFTQIRNDATRHGFVFLDCRLTSAPGVTGTFLARIDPNPGLFPFSEVVWLNTTMGDFLSPAGWLLNNATAGPNLHFWEYQSKTPEGTPLDVSGRGAFSRQLTLENDAETIRNYSTPSYVLGGWSPQLAPLITSQPTDQIVTIGQGLTVRVEASALPDPTYQWFKDGSAIPGATASALVLPRISNSDLGTYRVVVTNLAGSSISSPFTIFTALAAFTSRYGLDPATTGAAEADPDGDGLSNLLEFVLGGNPIAPGDANSPRIRLERRNNGPALVFQFDRQTAANSAVSSQVEYSADLVNWTRAVENENGVILTIAPLNASTERVTVVIPDPAARLFARLKASER